MTHNNFRKDANYWNDKLSVYLHDPPDKALRIQGHTLRSSKLAQILGGIPDPNSNFDWRADVIASGMDRVILPGYNPDPSRSGAVDFSMDPILTHPTGNDAPLKIDFEKDPVLSDIAESMFRIIREDLDGAHGKPGLSDQFSGDEAGFAAARFHYFHHFFRERLVQQDVGGLGGLWSRIPADTRIPDHSIWQHCAMVSSLTSSFRLSQRGQASLMVFNITPVQDFIARARKLRDFWTASLILSWLGFEAMRYIIYRFGSDHIVYPSVIDQPIINQFLDDELKLYSLDIHQEPVAPDHVASLPNKFVCVVPSGAEDEIALGVKQSILDAWNKLGQKLLKTLEGLLPIDSCARSIVERQFEGFWRINWASCPLLEDKENAKNAAKQLLSQNVWTYSFDMVEKASNLKSEWDHSGALYTVTHALSQSFLAAGKTRKDSGIDAVQGIKCQLHGNLEILRNQWASPADKNPSPTKDPFWNSLKESWKAKADFSETERLSAIALVKRLGYRIFRDDPSHPLSVCFQEGTSFPSTTEIAISDWFDKVRPNIPKTSINLANLREALAQHVHQQDEPAYDSKSKNTTPTPDPATKRLYNDLVRKVPLTDEDKYYAILLMDGDHMGKLINGETSGASWQTVIHPSLAGKLASEDFDSQINDFWKNRLSDKRLLGPGVHAGISEALADFSLYAVPAVIAEAKGKLIYAGGDDVCAVLPVSTAIGAARLISRLYSEPFRFFREGGPAWGEPIIGQWRPEPGKMSIHLGNAPGISISAGILICHHKKPLYVAMRRAHELLELAKSRGGRNAMALELEKRSGGPVTWITNWNSKVPDQLAIAQLKGKSLLYCFFKTVEAMASGPGGRELSSSLIYRLREFSYGIESIVKTHPDKLSKFIESLIGKSFNRKIDQGGLFMADVVSALLVRSGPDPAGNLVDTSPLLIARAMASRINPDPFSLGGEL